MSEKKDKKDSNELLNILMMLLGGLFLFLGVVNMLSYFEISLGLPAEFDQMLSSLGAFWSVMMVVGFFGLISGIGMFKEEEWAMGQALVVLPVMVTVSISQILLAIVYADWYKAWINFLPIITVVIGILGFFWLLMTRKRYD